MWLLSLVLCSCLALSTWGQQASTPIVDTQYGKVQGKYMSLKGFNKAVQVFLGVPFAKAPLGSLRFTPPQPPEPWDYVKITTTYPPMCIQDKDEGQLFSNLFTNRNEKISLEMSEDCLYLNIYSPADLTKKMKLPVMVWIHGGGLLTGAASTYDGLALSTLENVVVVTIQYRLGILGFYSTGDEHAGGNWGYLDQVAALHWIQKNIASFGGDPGSVTIFGESAGGGCVSALIVSPLAKNLFHRAISQSGVVLMESLFSSDIKLVTEKITKLIGCKITTSASMVSCIRQKTEEEILNTTVQMKLFTVDFLGDPTQKIAFIPAVLDGKFFPKNPKEILAEKQFNHIPYIVGINNNEFSWLLPTLMKYPPFEDRMDQEKAMLLVWKSYPLLKIPQNLIPLITKEYLGVTNDPVKKKYLFMDMMGDFFIGISAVMVARFHMASGAPTYMYEFQHRSSFWGNMKPETVRADHGDDIFPVLGAPFLKEGASEEEKQLSRTMMKYWANFARNGDPNGEGLLKWPAYDQDKQHLEFDINLAIGKKLKDKRLEFWLKTQRQEMVSSAVFHSSFHSLAAISLLLTLISSIIS
ncbi:liver carboxylesterase 1-like isoform X2 [Dromiciops gliroides]|uniref:liver carboxylesterase 1-like isoform X2 n=1 Tax=Dromiciops gliroides TaxID=33562 RepID=UPI001CC3D771|nr:liver carboxylesterase 1-like isoform X2 [Dromiciops gliroides]